MFYFKSYRVFHQNCLIKFFINSYKRTMSLSNGSTNRGALIVFEGCDRCGKSTQSSMLVEYLKKQNIPVKHMAFPDRTSPSGKLINAYLTNKQEMPDESIHLLFAINRWEIQNEIKKLLNNGTTLIVDRYSYSGVAYSTAKGLSFEWCQAPERGLIRPDLVFYLKTDIDTLTSRSNFGEERYEKKEFQTKVSQVFNEICKTESSYWTEVNAAQNLNSIHELVSSEAMNLIETVSKTPLNLLWK
ncbi:thymidylate kinase [Episyrphus balteatus]|uniref:thymidylate kinase n=1 Tax=Episyrphus balteatus TaxID=286459 RepID=UPI002485965D|nr:thymidylate kinase [Episyrphus balteatus]